jgi:plasmid stabilization system protein ParE
MTLPVVLRDEAQAEFDAAFDFYDAKRAGLGLAFVERVQQTFNRIQANPLMLEIVLGDIRKAVVTRFPYCVFYRPLSDRIEVLAVFQSSRDPSVWQARGEPGPPD